MTHFAIMRTSEGSHGARRAVEGLARKWPNVTGLQFVFIMVSAASAIEDVFTESAQDIKSRDQAMRIAAVLAVDLFALQQRGNFAPTGRDLLAYWEEDDDFFLSS